MLRDPRPAARWKRSARRVRILSLLATTGCAMICTFQNFEVPNELLRVQTPLERQVARALHWSTACAETMSLDRPTTDIRDLAPVPALPNDQMIASPQAGNDMGSIGQDWATREAHLITGGGDERLMTDINKKLSHLLQGDGQVDATAAEVTAAAPASRAPASLEGTSQSTMDVIKPKSVRMTAVNRVQVDWATNTQLGCAVQGSSVLVDVSQPLSDTLNVNLHHDTNGSKSMVNVSYRW